MIFFIEEFIMNLKHKLVDFLINLFFYSVLN